MMQFDIFSIAELERRADVGVGTINKRKLAYELPTIKTATGMCQALRVSWVELWTHAGLVDHISNGQLTGLDFEIYQIVKDTDDDFKRAVLESIEIWLAVHKRGIK